MITFELPFCRCEHGLDAHDSMMIVCYWEMHGRDVCSFVQLSISQASLLALSSIDRLRGWLVQWNRVRQTARSTVIERVVCGKLCASVSGRPCSDNMLRLDYRWSDVFASLHLAVRSKTNAGVAVVV